MISLVGKVIMAIIWVFMLYNLVIPFQGHARILIYMALAFFIIFHGMQAMLYKSTIQPGEKYRKKMWGLFFFGIFETLSWHKELKEKGIQK